MPLLLAILALVAATPPGPAIGKEEGRVCYSATQAREVVAAHNLADPLTTLRAVALARHADPLVSRLCKSGGEWIYEVTLLPRDGKLTRIEINAENGSLRKRSK